MLHLERSGATGTLNVEPTRSLRAQLTFLDGRVVHAAMSDTRRLGRYLATALPSSGDGLIGERLLQAGDVDAGELAHALRRQLRQRVVSLFGWRAPALSFAKEVRATPIPEPWSTLDLVLAALRTQSSAPSVIERIRRLPWRLQPAGERLHRATLFPEERAMLLALREGVLGADALAMVGHAERAQRALVGWHRLGLIAAPRGADYALLLRKQRELRRGACASRLLDLPRGASRPEARRALRRLLRSVHPDRFEGSLQDASAEVARALIAAERAFH